MNLILPLRSITCHFWSAWLNSMVLGRPPGTQVVEPERRRRRGASLTFAAFWLPFNIDVGHFGQVDSNGGYYYEDGGSFNNGRLAVHPRARITVRAPCPFTSGPRGRGLLPLAGRRPNSAARPRENGSMAESVGQNRTLKGPAGEPVMRGDPTFGAKKSSQFLLTVFD
jgi:hypothetical protein